jgi:hypothetical protein
MQLYHFSDDAAIGEFVPRPVRVPSARPAGMEWLNGPLVWAIEDARQQLYLFPRDCPRIVLWSTPRTSPNDRERWLPGIDADGCLAYIEARWHARFASAVLYRYALPTETFIDLHDAGMWVSRERVTPLDTAEVRDLAAALAQCRTTLRIVGSLLPFRDVWRSSVHASGIRLRNAQGWG